MTYVAREAREQLLETLAEAADALGGALAALGAAYEVLDDHTADRLEETLFGPAQAAYGRARRTHTAFAARHGLPERTFASASPGLPSQGARGFIERALDAFDDAEDALVELQDSMLPVEVGDPELRAGLAEVREIVARLQAAGPELLRTLGR